MAHSNVHEMIDVCRQAVGMARRSIQDIIANRSASPTCPPCECPAQFPPLFVLSAMLWIGVIFISIMCYDSLTAPPCRTCKQNALLPAPDERKTSDEDPARLTARLEAKKIQWDRLEKVFAARAAGLQRTMEIQNTGNGENPGTEVQEEADYELVDARGDDERMSN